MLELPNLINVALLGSPISKPPLHIPDISNYLEVEPLIKVHF